MNNNVKCFMAVLLLGVLSGTTLAIQCYQCESISNPKCGENFEAEDRMKFDCSRVAPPRFLQTIIPSLRNATGCMKKALETGSGHPQIIRTCYFGDVHNTQTGCQPDPHSPFIRQLSCDVCSDNLCNNAEFNGPAALTIALFLALARLFS